MEKSEYFTLLENDIEFGKYQFPSLDQYQTRIDSLRKLGIPEPTIAINAQYDWHSRGQNGCNFARIAARKAVELGWQSSYISDANVDDIDQLMKKAEANNDCEIMSLVFKPVNPDELLNTITSLTEETLFYLEKDHLIDNDSKRQLYLRYPLSLGKVAAWSMCFAPYDFMPNTRRSPYIEIATRMKDKPDGLHEMLNQKEGEAHLADLIVDSKPEHTARRIITTIGRTATILGKKPNHITAAKSTLTVPLDEL